MNQRIEKVVLKVSQDFALTKVSYLIAIDDRISTQNPKTTFEKTFDEDFYRRLLNEYSAPILLDSLVKDSVIKETVPTAMIVPDLPFKRIDTYNLIATPASYNNPAFNSNNRIKLIAKVIGKGKLNVGLSAINQFNTDRLGLEEPSKSQYLFSNLLKISRYFDQEQIALNTRDTMVSGLSKTWYAQNIKSFFGWHVLQFQTQTVLWNHYRKDQHNIILIKVPDRGLFFAVSFETTRAPLPDSYHKEDILQSPIALAILNFLNKPAGEPVIDYTGNDYHAISEKLFKYKNSPYSFLSAKELLAYARYYEAIGSLKKSTLLYAIHKRLLFNPKQDDYKNEFPLAYVDYVSDNLNSETPFALQNDTVVQIFAQGQLLKVGVLAQNAFQYDNVQIFFNHPKEENTGSDEAQLFEFNYMNDKIGYSPSEHVPVSWLDSTHIKYVFANPDDQTYCLEVSIPWEEIKGVKKDNARLNFLINDSDLEEGSRESVLSMFIQSGVSCFDPLKMGIIKNKKHKGPVTPGTLQCIATNIPVKIDGRPDELWNKIQSYKVQLPYVNHVSDFDNKASVKTVYDKKNIYFFFRVSDNSKNKLGLITKDKCWIENAVTHEIVWKMTGAITESRPSFYVDNHVFLKAGNYTLKYTSDKGHSFTGWYGRPRETSFYGAYLYYLKK